MPSPIVLKVEFSADGPEILSMPYSQLMDDNSAIVRWPVDVWFDGKRTIEVELNFGPRQVEKITLDPSGRFPDSDTSDNAWPR